MRLEIVQQKLFDNQIKMNKSLENLPNYVYTPTLNLVNYVKSLNVPVICFPREIKNYKEFCDIVKPDVVSIDYNVDPKKILRDIKIPVQGGLDPKILLTDKETLKKEASKYLDIGEKLLLGNHPHHPHLPSLVRRK